MNRVVRGSSLLIVTAIVAACAAKRDEGPAARGTGRPRPAAARDRRVDASRDKAAARERRPRGSHHRRTRWQSRSRKRRAGAPLGPWCELRRPALSAPRRCISSRRTPSATSTSTTTRCISSRSSRSRPSRSTSTPARTRTCAASSTRAAAAAGRRARRGDGQLLRLRYAPPASRDVPFRVATEWRRRRGIRRRCS